MAADPEEIQALGEAMRVSPDNVPLRVLLADKLLECGWCQEAEKEYRQALAHDAANAAAQSGLAHALYAQGKYDQALALVEDVLKRAGAAPRLLLLHARLLLHRGDTPAAVRQYRQAVEANPALADHALAHQLGLS
jgi:tetratricopeptide (TPR) repeat protein